MFGMLVAENTGNIYNSNATGSLNYQYIVRDTSVTNGQASKSAIGGLIGVSSNTGVIDKSYAAVNVATSYSIAAQESEAHAGGLVGRVSGRLANSYTTGSVNTT